MTEIPDRPYPTGTLLQTDEAQFWVLDDHFDVAAPTAWESITMLSLAGERFTRARPESVRGVVRRPPPKGVPFLRGLMVALYQLHMDVTTAELEANLSDDAESAEKFMQVSAWSAMREALQHVVLEGLEKTSDDQWDSTRESVVVWASDLRARGMRHGPQVERRS